MRGLDDSQNFNLLKGFIEDTQIVFVESTSKHSQQIRDAYVNQILVVVQYFLEVVGFWASVILFTRGIRGFACSVVFGITLFLPLFANSVCCVKHKTTKSRSLLPIEPRSFPILVVNEVFKGGDQISRRRLLSLLIF